MSVPPSPDKADGRYKYRTYFLIYNIYLSKLLPSIIYVGYGNICFVSFLLLRNKDFDYSL